MVQKKKKKQTSTPTQLRLQILLTSFSLASVSKLFKLMNFGFRMLPFFLFYFFVVVLVAAEKINK